MSFIALLMIGETDLSRTPIGFERVGGISLLERQIRMLLKAGADGVWLVAPVLPAANAQGLSRQTQGLFGSRVRRVTDAAGLAHKLQGEERPILHLAPGQILDERLIEALLEQGLPPETVSAQPSCLLCFGAVAPEGAERLDSMSHWAGAALFPAALVQRVASELGDWELSGTLLRSAVEAGAEKLFVEDVPTYAPNRRRKVPLTWARPQSAQAVFEAEAQLLQAAQKGCLDWPAQYLHPPVENRLVRWLMNTPVTPNQVTFFTALIGAGAIAAFGLGFPMWGLLLMLLIGPLDGVDGKLARMRFEFSRWGDLEHVLDKLVEYGVFIAMAVWFSQTYGLAAWLACAGIILFALTEAVTGEFFRRFTGRQLDDWGPFERRFRFIGGRRNTFFWTLVPFGVFDAWWAGYLMILIYSVLTFLIVYARFFKALSEYGRSESPRIEQNFLGTAYVFLPKSKSGAR